MKVDAKDVLLGILIVAVLYGVMYGMCLLILWMDTVLH